MKVSASIALLSCLVISANARVGTQTDSAAPEATVGADQENRALATCGNGAVLINAWHPNYSAGWTNGDCRFTKDCNSPSFSTELACCKGAYAGQTSGFCLSSLPNPPTTSPTGAGGLDIYYPLYEASGGWSSGYCTNNRPLPAGRPTYTTMLGCCKGAYAGQMSGFCLSKLPSPPTTAPTGTGGADFWYPEYDKPWATAGCKNTLPLPFTPGGRPTFDTQLACCKGAYAGQTSGMCLQLLPSPPTTAPTGAGGLDFWYPDYDKAWALAGCSNKRPAPFASGGRPTYDTQLACCKGAYAGQMSGMCLQQLPSPPTTAPTGAGGLDFWYPDYDTAWADAGCSNNRPIPFGPGGRPTFATQLACCKGAYAGQTSGKCLQLLPSPPTTAPTGAGGLDFWYPDYTTGYAAAGCSNKRPAPFATGGRPTYDTQLACCKGAYAGQTSGACLSQLPTPPTTSPTEGGGLDVYYKGSASNYALGTCINDRPLPAWQPTYSTKASCCTAQYGSQSSDACQCDAVGICYSCNCGTELQRNTTGAGCPGLVCV